MSYGVRALAKLLITYQSKYSLHTIAGIIGRWAPPKENNTTAYITAVCSYFGKGFSPQAVLDLNNQGQLDDLVSGIIAHENGLTWPFSAALNSDITSGVTMALAK